jgi:hypothetical protein
VQIHSAGACLPLFKLPFAIGFVKLTACFATRHGRLYFNKIADITTSLIKMFTYAILDNGEKLFKNNTLLQKAKYCQFMPPRAATIHPYK